MSESVYATRSLRVTAKNAAGEVVKVVEVVGEPALISQQLMHVDGIVSVDFEYLGEADDAVG